MSFDQATAESLLEADRYSQALGVRLISVEPDQITLGLDVEERHTNFLEIGHGGMVFSLADCALSLASNTNYEKALAVDAHVALTGGARPGDSLVARITPATSSRNLATYRVEVENQDGRAVALFTGTVFIAAS